MVMVFFRESLVIISVAPAPAARTSLSSECSPNNAANSKSIHELEAPVSSIKEPSTPLILAFISR